MLTEAAETSAALTGSPVSQEVTRFKNSITHPSWTIWTIWTSPSGDVLTLQQEAAPGPEMLVPEGPAHVLQLDLDVLVLEVLVLEVLVLFQLIFITDASGAPQIIDHFNFSASFKLF